MDTCAAEFAAYTPYHYSSYDEEDEIALHSKPSILILGSGPNRIGQGIEFDYSCVHASMALRKAGYETVMVNCNPETVSTDYDVSTRLYFEPLTLEDVLEVIAAEERTGGVMGVFVQLGGQTPLKLAQQLADAGVPILGTSPEAIDLAAHPGEFSRVLDNPGLVAPETGTAVSFPAARQAADQLRHPLPAPLPIRPLFATPPRPPGPVGHLVHSPPPLAPASRLSLRRPAVGPAVTHHLLRAPWSIPRHIPLH